MIFFATLMLMSVAAAPTLAAVERLAPRAAGELALAGRDHRPIVAVNARDQIGPVPPGLFEIEMIERPIMAAGGCVREQWTVGFQGDPKSRGEARLTNAYAATQVALRRRTGCPRDFYVRLNSGIGAAQAIADLVRLDAIRTSRAKVQFTCSDATSSGLCGDPRRLRRELAGLAPWAVRRERGETIFWLGAVERRPMQPVTEVRFFVADPSRVRISRSHPAPF